MFRHTCRHKTKTHMALTQNFWAYFWFVEQMLLNLSFFVHNASWFNVKPFIGTSGMRKRPECPREKTSLEIFLAVFKSIMSCLWQFIVTPKCLICLETVNCKKDSGAADEVERVVPFSHLIWIFFNLNQMTQIFYLNIHKLLTSVIWEALSIYQAGQTEHVFHCKMLWVL